MYGGYYGYRSTHYDYHGYESYCGHYHDADMRERPLEDRHFPEPMDDSYVDAGAVPDHGIGEAEGEAEAEAEADFDAFDATDMFGDEAPDGFDAADFEGGFDEEAMMGMYAGAGPRDLPDGSDGHGPSGGSGATGVRAGARASRWGSSSSGSSSSGSSSGSSRECADPQEAEEEACVAAADKNKKKEKGQCGATATPPRKDAAVFRQLRAIHRQHQTTSVYGQPAATGAGAGRGTGIMAAAIAITIDEKWEAIEHHAQDAAYGRTVPVDYHVLPAAFPDHVAMMARERGVVVGQRQRQRQRQRLRSPEPGLASAGSAGCGCTLVTQLSLDRLPQFEEQANAWDGGISAAVYVPYAAPPTARGGDGDGDGDHRAIGPSSPTKRAAPCRPSQMCTTGS
jgi:hypothetical protein